MSGAPLAQLSASEGGAGKLKFHGEHADAAAFAAADPSAARFFKDMNTTLGHKLYETHVHLNHSKHDTLEPSKGFVSVMADNALLSAKWMPFEMCSQVMAVRVLGIRDKPAGSPISESLLEERLARLDVLVNEPVTAATHLLRVEDAYNLDEKPTNAEFRSWLPDVGKKAVVGVYRTDGERKKFYIVAYLPRIAIGENLFKKIRDEQSGGAYTEAGRFRKSAIYKATHQLARRNCRRVLARVADLLGLNIRRLPDTLSIEARTPGTPASSIPQLAEPDFACEMNVFKRYSMGFLDKSTVAFYNHAIPTSSCKNGVVFPVGPAAGFRLFKKNGVNAPVLQWRNSAANSFPCGLGRTIHPSKSKDLDLAALTQDEQYVLANRFTWKGKTAGDVHPDLHSHQYRVYSKGVRDTLAKLYTPASGADVKRTKALKPVIALITAAK